jgi:hydroxymethylpyrimidine pyrophosphatase-like HAD family hydrolase
MVRMIALDMDGTLLGPDGRVSMKNLAAIRSAASEGLRIVVATGRRHTFALQHLRDMGLDEKSALVSSNGAVTRMLDPEAHLLNRTFLSMEASLWLCDHLAEFRNALVMTFDRVGPEGEDVRGALVVERIDELHASIGRWMTANAPYIACINPIEQALIGPHRQDTNPPIQMMLCGTVKRMKHAEARLLEHPGVLAVGAPSTPGRPEARIALSRTEYPERDLRIVDILPAGCSKGTALLRLAREWSIRPEEILAIGDNWNDLSMLELAGFPVLMGNAPDDLRIFAAERGWAIGSRHDDDGVAKAIESMLSINNTYTEPVGSVA